jgi:bleomycin hydrolase
MKYLNIFTILLIFVVLPAFSQNNRKDKGHFIEYKNEFWEKINKTTTEYASKPKEKKKKLSFKMDFEGIDIPQFDDFEKYWHFPPISQGNTGTCWDFSTTSFLESEIKRINDKEIKISEMFTAYWQYVEKARRYVRERGDSEFGQGSEANAVTEMWKQYGCVPEDVYIGKKEDEEFYNHTAMFDEMYSYLKNCRKTNFWDETTILNNIKSIMNYYMGEPPANFNYEGRTYTPKSFLSDVVKLNPDDYVGIMSLLEPGYWKIVSYDVPDNWWHSKTYYNIPLDNYIDVIKQAVKAGYTFAIGGDVSESGYNSHYDAAMVPSYDIPSSYINDMARQFRFSNKTTTDDHGIHVVGYYENGDDFWLLIKDSGSGSRNGKAKGYYFYHIDYIKLKMIGIFIHKSAVEDILKKFK